MTSKSESLQLEYNFSKSRKVKSIKSTVNINSLKY